MTNRGHLGHGLTAATEVGSITVNSAMSFTNMALAWWPIVCVCMEMAPLLLVLIAIRSSIAGWHCQCIYECTLGSAPCAAATVGKPSASGTAWNDTLSQVTRKTLNFSVHYATKGLSQGPISRCILKVHTKRSCQALVNGSGYLMAPLQHSILLHAQQQYKSHPSSYPCQLNLTGPPLCHRPGDHGTTQRKQLLCPLLLWPSSYLWFPHQLRWMPHSGHSHNDHSSFL